MTERLMLLDTASLYFRAFHGVPDTVRAPDGTPVNAVRGLLDMIARLVTDFEPDALVACWDDAWRPQWRVDLIASYKQHRVAREVPGGVDVEETPEALVAQIPVIREVLAALGVTVLGADDHEADDVIGTLATRADGPVDIVTGDRDLFQLVDDRAGIRVIYTARGMSRLELVTDEVVRGKYGVEPRQYVDFAVMRGDASDGLPGVSGIGEKTAATLLADFGSLAAIQSAAGGSSGGDGGADARGTAGGGADARGTAGGGAGRGGGAGDGGAGKGATMSAAVRAKIGAASAYLAVAPRVVEVVRDLELGAFDARITAPTEAQRTALAELDATWGLGRSADRAVAALG